MPSDSAFGVCQAWRGRRYWRRFASDTVLHRPWRACRWVLAAWTWTFVRPMALASSSFSYMPYTFWPVALIVASWTSMSTRMKESVGSLMLFWWAASAIFYVALPEIVCWPFLNDILLPQIFSISNICLTKSLVALSRLKRHLQQFYRDILTFILIMFICGEKSQPFTKGQDDSDVYRPGLNLKTPQVTHKNFSTWKVVGKKSWNLNRGWYLLTVE